MFYSATTGGFYDREIHGDNIPADAVEISAEEHAALLKGQSNGKIIAGDENGYPVLQDTPLPDTTAVRRAEIISRLTAIDAESIRPAREVSAALAAGQLAPAFSVSKLAALETEAASLRTELRGLPA